METSRALSFHFAKDKKSAEREAKEKEEEKEKDEGECTRHTLL